MFHVGALSIAPWRFLFPLRDKGVGTSLNDLRNVLSVIHFDCGKDGESTGVLGSIVKESRDGFRFVSPGLEDQAAYA
jgi:hypothetical protein